jgi:hypothetical protein
METSASITPSQIYAWEGLGPDVLLTGTTEERLPSEQKWCALTSRVVDAKVEADGDIHIALQDANGNNVGTVSAEIPVGPKWCEIRQTVFGWTFTGEFSHIKDRVFDNGLLQWSVIYEQNQAVLAVAQAPDQGSTFVLLTLGLLGLVTFRRQLLRGRP